MLEQQAQQDEVPAAIDFRPAPAGVTLQFGRCDLEESATYNLHPPAAPDLRPPTSDLFELAMCSERRKTGKNGFRSSENHVGHSHEFFKEKSRCLNLLPRL